MTIAFSSYMHIVTCSSYGGLKVKSNLIYIKYLHADSHVDYRQRQLNE